MILLRDLNHIPDIFRNAVVAMGNFDGVHRGHQAVIGDAYERAQSLGVALIVLTFSPHPRRFFNPTSPPFVIMPLNQKMPYLSALGVAGVVALNFEDFKDMNAPDFIQTVLVDALQVSTLSVGYDFRFGNARTGCVEMLRHDGRFQLMVAPKQQDASGDVFSSTLIRQYIRDGMVASAGVVLGHAFEIHGVVVHGNAVGRTLGYPTANIDFADYIIRPKYGVYAVRLGIKNAQDDTESVQSWHAGICNIGVRPTVDGIREVLEVHVFDYDASLYDIPVRIAFVEHIRNERKFTDLQGLKDQIKRDCIVAKRMHNLHRIDGADDTVLGGYI